jgi:oligosaccharide repeat unit polymerase
MLSGKLNIVDYNGLIKRLPMGMLSIFLLISTLFSLFFSSFIVKRNELKYKFWFLTLLFFTTLISTVWQGKRQGILMLFFFVISRFFQKSDDSKYIYISFSKKIYFTIFFFLFVFSFMQIGRVRHNDTNVDNTEILSYTMFPVMNFAYTVSNTNFYGHSIFPNAVTNDLFPRRIADNKFINQIETITFEPSSPSGYLNSWYYDFGIFGIIFGTLLLSFFSLYFYKRRNYNENNMRKNILILWCCATVGVYNHFITLNYFLIPMISIIGLDIFSVKHRHVC